MKEHKTAVDKGNTLHSAVAEHVYEAHHAVDLDNIKVVKSEGNKDKRLVREAIQIHKEAPSMNRDRGTEIPVPFRRLLTVGNQRDRVTSEPQVHQN